MISLNQYAYHWEVVIPSLPSISVNVTWWHSENQESPECVDCSNNTVERGSSYNRNRIWISCIQIAEWYKLQWHSHRLRVNINQNMTKIDKLRISIISPDIRNFVWFFKWRRGYWFVSTVSGLLMIIRRRATQWAYPLSNLVKYSLWYLISEMSENWKCSTASQLKLTELPSVW